MPRFVSGRCSFTELPVARGRPSAKAAGSPAANAVPPLGSVTTKAAVSAPAAAPNLFESRLGEAIDLAVVRQQPPPDGVMQLQRARDRGGLEPLPEEFDVDRQPILGARIRESRQQQEPGGALVGTPNEGRMRVVGRVNLELSNGLRRQPGQIARPGNQFGPKDVRDSRDVLAGRRHALDEPAAAVLKIAVDLDVLPDRQCLAKNPEGAELRRGGLRRRQRAAQRREPAVGLAALRRFSAQMDFDRRAKPRREQPELVDGVRLGVRRRRHVASHDEDAAGIGAERERCTNHVHLRHVDRLQLTGVRGAFNRRQDFGTMKHASDRLIEEQ